ncbi:hypothetical protein [Peribacillus frigoritolerans]|uniref:hypothetical protein n=1 Tax=Peribacillus frigoritolerans TaxID=450367 RepID=UPI00341557F4
MWGKYLWRLRLLLFIPIVLYTIFMYSSFDSDEGFPSSYFLILAVYTLIIAVLMPFIVKGYFKSKIADYETIADLGTIGDFIGGTTVLF